MFIMTGLRKGELLKLKVTDVDIIGGRIIVRAETAKNRRPRVVGINSTLKEILSEYLIERGKKKSETISFWTSNLRNRAFTDDGLKHLFDAISKKTKFPIRAHKFRHTCATELYEATNDLVSIKEILGHRSISTTQIYTQVKAEKTMETLEMNPLKGLF